jgi:NADPH2:quinone reductase
MPAWQVAELGEPSDVLRLVQLPLPTAGPGQVVVRVAAVACNSPDILVGQGRYQERPPLPFTPGMELAGEVVAVGDGSSARVGDRVIGQTSTHGAATPSTRWCRRPASGRGRRG